MACSRLLAAAAVALALAPAGCASDAVCSLTQQGITVGAALSLYCENPDARDASQWRLSYALTNPNRDFLDVYVTYDGACRDLSPPLLYANNGTFLGVKAATVAATDVRCAGASTSCCLWLACANLVVPCSGQVLQYLRVWGPAGSVGLLSPKTVAAVVAAAVFTATTLLGCVLRRRRCSCSCCCCGGSRKMTGAAPAWEAVEVEPVVEEVRVPAWFGLGAAAALAAVKEAV